MKARVFCLVISSVISVVQVSAWTHHGAAPTSHHRRQASHRHQQSKHVGLYATSSNDDNVDNTSSTTSRRQWLGSLISTTAVGVLGSSATARAADLITTAAVCDPGVSVWKRGQRIIYLLGTAHISSASAQLAGDLVRDIHPKGVFVELDAKRITGSGLLAGRVQGAGGGMDEDTTTPTSRVIIPNIQVISSSAASASSSTTGASPLTTSDSSMAVSTASMNGVAVPSPASVPPPNPIMRAASRAIGNSIKGMYQKLDSAGFQAGEEFVVAIREGQRLGSDIVLGDRDVEVTLRRLTEGLARTDLQALMNPDSELEQSLKELVPAQVASSPTGDIGDLSDAEFRQEFSSFVEAMKAKENVRKIMAQLERLAPALYEALVSERDAYMAAGLNGLDELETIVAVMGVAHVDGVERNLAMNGWKNIQPKCGSQRR